MPKQDNHRLVECVVGVGSILLSASRNGSVFVIYAVWTRDLHSRSCENAIFGRSRARYAIVNFPNGSNSWPRQPEQQGYGLESFLNEMKVWNKRFLAVKLF
jgi:hypothetical protein